jgi:phosphohistidine phosphatase SixA
MSQGLVAAFALAACAMLALPSAAAEPELEGKALFAALKTGGYVIYLRHGITDLSQEDQKPITVGDCTTQRNLSQQGQAQARAIGIAFKTLGIPIGKVTSSPYCRTEDTAKLAFGSVQPVAALNYSFSLSKEAASKAAAELRQELSRAPAGGSNAMIVGHVTNLRDVAGVWPKTEGGGIVLAPDGSGFRVIGSFTAAELISAAN